MWGVCKLVVNAAKPSRTGRRAKSASPGKSERLSRSGKKPVDEMRRVLHNLVSLLQMQRRKKQEAPDQTVLMF
jgi:hypothetical protein